MTLGRFSKHKSERDLPMPRTVVLVANDAGVATAFLEICGEFFNAFSTPRFAPPNTAKEGDRLTL